MTKFPETPFPSIGELVFELSVKSGLVPSTAKEPNPLYEELKAYRDERARHGKQPFHFINRVILDIEKRFDRFIQSEIHSVSTFGHLCKAMEWYADLMAVSDVTLLNREQVVEILWMSAFPASSSAFLKAFAQIHPETNPLVLLSSKEPLADYLRGICKRGNEDYKAIARYRATKHDIDEDNCRKTLETWLISTVPGLENLIDVMEALGYRDDTGKMVWLFVARLLSKIRLEKRRSIFVWMQNSSEFPPPAEMFRLLKIAKSDIVGKALNIGPDRPWFQIRAALYKEEIARDGAQLERMIARQAKTWEPMIEMVQHEIDWFNGRYLALQGRYEEAYLLYVDGYNNGVRRNKDVLTDLLDELLALAARLGKAKEVKRYHELLQLTGVTDWDGKNESLNEHFERKFPASLRYPANDYLKTATTNMDAQTAPKS